MQKNKKLFQLLSFLGLAFFAWSAQAATISFDPPTEYETVQDLLGGVLTVLQGTIVVISLIFIVIGALLYITSAGSAQIEKAKKAITASMIGLAIGVAAPALLKQIAEIVGWTPTSTPSEYDEALTLLEISQNVLNFLLSIVGILSIIMLVIGGAMYIAAGGSERNSEAAKKIIMYSIVGIAVALSSLVIVRTIVGFFAN